MSRAKWRWFSRGSSSASGSLLPWGQSPTLHSAAWPRASHPSSRTMPHSPRCRQPGGGISRVFLLLPTVACGQIPHETSGTPSSYAYGSCRGQSEHRARTWSRQSESSQRKNPQSPCSPSMGSLGSGSTRVPFHRKRKAGRSFYFAHPNAVYLRSATRAPSALDAVGTHMETVPVDQRRFATVTVSVFAAFARHVAF